MMRTIITHLFLLLSVSTAKRSTNIVILLADDFGYSDLAVYGSPSQEFGHLDQLALDGVRFTSWLAPESVCTPSRAALQTGRLPIRTGMIPEYPPPAGDGSGEENRVLSVIDSGGLPKNETSIADLVKERGYKTGFVGKWHGGINGKYNGKVVNGEHLPSRHGYDYVGLNLPFTNHWDCDETTNHKPAPSVEQCLLYSGDELIQQPIDHSNLTAAFAADATAFIKNSASSEDPFLLFFGFAQMHVSMFSSPAFNGTSKNGVYGDGVREMDWAAGQILQSLRTAGILDDTMVVFTSDHGPHIELCLEGGRAGPFRGGKGYSSWEGGLRVPGIISWPKMTKLNGGGIVSDVPVTSMDLFKTIDEVTSPPNSLSYSKDDRLYDGVSLLPLLQNKNISARTLFHYCADVLMAARRGPFKVKFFEEKLPDDQVLSEPQCTQGIPVQEYFETWDCHGDHVLELDPPMLFNVETDAAERWMLNADNVSLSDEAAEAMKLILDDVSNHKKTLVPGPTQLRSDDRPLDPELQPCCGGRDVDTNECLGCNYPNPNPRQR